MTTAMETTTEPTTHLARCPTCDERLIIIRSASGNSFEIMNPKPDVAYGIGANGLPICPTDGVEMELADDQLPAVEQPQTEPVQQGLPGVTPPFNYQGAYMEIEAMAVECERLRGEYDEAAKDAKDARKRWETAATRLNNATLEFRKRRRAKLDQIEQASTEQSEPAQAETWEPSIETSDLEQPTDEQGDTGE